MNTRTTLYFLVALAALLPFGCDGNLLLAPRAVGSLAQTTDISAPSFSPAADTYSTDQSVTITSATSDVAIYYTVTSDGSVPSDPTASSIHYSTPIQVSGNSTAVASWRIRAIAMKAGMNDSAVTSGTFNIDCSKVSTPWFSPAAGSYTSDQSVAISCATTGAVIYYMMTKDGSAPPEPTALSIPYSTPIQISGNSTAVTSWKIKAIAMKAGMNDSEVASGTFNIDCSKVSTPWFTPAAGLYTSDQSVAISCATTGAAVYYTMTTDGSAPLDPTTSSTKYATEIPVAGNGVTVRIKAIAIKAGMKDSSIFAPAAAFTVTYPGSITVSFPPSDTPVVFSGNSATVQKGTNMTVTTTFAATSYAWYLDFSAVPASTASSCTVTTSPLGYGMHTLVLVVVSSGVAYSGSFNFQVTQ